MTEKEEFLKTVESLLKVMDSPSETIDRNAIYFNDQSKKYCEFLITHGKANPTSMGSASIFTDTNLKILICMRENYKKHNNVFSSKSIGDEIFMTSRSVSGSIRKLVELGFVEKMGKNPVSYSLTQKGIEYDLNQEL